MYEYLRRREMEKKILAWLIYAFILTLHHLWFETSWLFLTFPVITMCWLPLTLFNKKNYFRVAWCDVFNSILHQLLLFICVHTCNIFPLFFLQITGLINWFWKGIRRKWSSIFIQYDEINIFQNIQKCGIHKKKKKNKCRLAKVISKHHSTTIG